MKESWTILKENEKKSLTFIGQHSTKLWIVITLNYSANNYIKLLPK